MCTRCLSLPPCPHSRIWSRAGRFRAGDSFASRCSRRACCACWSLPRWPWAWRCSAPAPPQRPALVLLRLGDQQRLEVHPFDGQGAAQLEAFQAIDAFFRASSGHEVLVDPALVDLLMRVQQELAGEPLVLVSGHRQPGRGTSGKSYHVSGMAADVAAPRAGVQELRRAALRAGAGGVGLYPHFVHVDARAEPYRWVGGRWPRRR
ncbi:MAG: DUF882 domain-containing protein [Polyangiaceae bacterium]